MLRYVSRAGGQQDSPRSGMKTSGRCAMPDRYGDELPAHVVVAAIVECELCDDDGYRGSQVCDHIDHHPAYGRGMALVRAALKRGGGK
jgi:hypothetical protein